MANYIQLKHQIEKLQKEAELLRKRERAETIYNIKQAIAAFELTADELGLSSSISSRRGRTPGKKPVSMKSAGNKRRGRQPKKAADTGRQPSPKAAVRSSPLDKRSVVAAKYRDAASGASWAGRGKQPKWLVAALKDGKRLDDFKI